MTRTLVLLAAATGLAVSTAFAQAPQLSSPAASDPPADAKSGGSQFVAAPGPDEWLASSLRGTTVLGSDNQKVGEVADILLDRGGQIRAFVVAVGDASGQGGKEVAIDLTQFREARARGDTRPQLKVRITKDQLAQAPEFKSASNPPTTTGAAPSRSHPSRPHRRH